MSLKARSSHVATFVSAHPNLAAKDAKSRYNTRLARLLPGHVHSPCVVNWDVLNRMGCDEEIDDMLRIRLREVELNEEIFTFVVWIRAFNINEPIYVELCHEFYSTYEFDKADELEKDGFNVYFEGGLRSDEHFNAQEYWLSISREENLGLSRSHTSTIRSPILRVIHKMITYGLCQRTTGFGSPPLRDLMTLEGKLLSRITAGSTRVGFLDLQEHLCRTWDPPGYGSAASYDQYYSNTSPPPSVFAAWLSATAHRIDDEERVKRGREEAEEEDRDVRREERGKIVGDGRSEISARERREEVARSGRRVVRGKIFWRARVVKDIGVGGSKEKLVWFRERVVEIARVRPRGDWEEGGGEEMRRRLRQGDEMECGRCLEIVKEGCKICEGSSVGGDGGVGVGRDWLGAAEEVYCVEGERMRYGEKGERFAEERRGED
ncbi:hypothetical protein Tco_1019110 [Tanacetum coccineum]|uniref:Uncharacterized protein n=1 Tax=Tanacetum coccineum TaxID=301880 RepID=A0ABQ5FWG5_9ASTR